jgi:hypothetical protein
MIENGCRRDAGAAFVLTPGIGIGLAIAVAIGF